MFKKAVGALVVGVVVYGAYRAGKFLYEGYQEMSEDEKRRLKKRCASNACDIGAVVAPVVAGECAKKVVGDASEAFFRD